MNLSGDNARESSTQVGGGRGEKDASSGTQSDVATLWEDLKQLNKRVIEKMNQVAELRTRTGGLEIQFADADKIIVINDSAPAIAVTITLHHSSIEILSSIVVEAPILLEEQSSQTLEVDKNEDGQLLLRNNDGERWTTDKAVYNTLRQFLHLSTRLANRA